MSAFTPSPSSHPSPSGAADSARSAARRASDHPALEWSARAGYVMSGVVHLLIGWLAIRIATGSGGGEASNSGALAEIARAPGGAALLWFGVVAFVALGLWQLLEAAVGASETSDRVKAAAKAVVYLALAVTTATFARGGSSSDGAKSSDATAGLLRNGAGKAVLVAVGLAIVAVGVYHVYKGVTKRFLDDLDHSGSGEVGTAIRVAGTAGYAAKGVALAVLGGLVVTAALTADPAKASGLDAALRTLGGQPFGAVLLVVVGAGIALYGLYSFGRARYASM